MTSRPRIHELHVRDEFDKAELAALFRTHTKMLVLEDLPGVGKTAALTNF